MYELCHGAPMAGGGIGTPGLVLTAAQPRWWLCVTTSAHGEALPNAGGRSIGPAEPEPDGSFLVELHLRAEGAEPGGVETPTALGVVDDRVRLLAGRDAQDDEDAALVLDAAMHARLHDAVPLEDRI